MKGGGLGVLGLGVLTLVLGVLGFLPVLGVLFAGSRVMTSCLSPVRGVSRMNSRAARQISPSIKQPASASVVQARSTRT
jgi:hypothetical protein